MKSLLINSILEILILGATFNALQLIYLFRDGPFMISEHFQKREDTDDSRNVQYPYNFEVVKLKSAIIPSQINHQSSS